MSGDRLIVTARKSVTGNWWAEAKDAARHSTVSRTLPWPKMSTAPVLKDLAHLTPLICIWRLHLNAQWLLSNRIFFLSSCTKVVSHLIFPIWVKGTIISLMAQLRNPVVMPEIFTSIRWISPSKYTWIAISTHPITSVISHWSYLVAFCPIPLPPNCLSPACIPHGPQGDLTARVMKSKLPAGLRSSVVVSPITFCTSPHSLHSRQISFPLFSGGRCALLQLRVEMLHSTCWCFCLRCSFSSSQGKCPSILWSHPHPSYGGPRFCPNL